jgi:DNA-binding protein HU-beta
VALTQFQMIAAVAEMSTADANRALAALDEIVLEELGNAQKVRIGGLVQLTVRVKPAQKKRRGRNPATGEEIDVPAKPASVDVRARPLAKAKGAATVGAEGAAAARGVERPRHAVATTARGTWCCPARAVALLT